MNFEDVVLLIIRGIGVDAQRIQHMEEVRANFLRRRSRANNPAFQEPEEGVDGKGERCSFAPHPPYESASSHHAVSFTAVRLLFLNSRFA